MVWNTTFTWINNNGSDWTKRQDWRCAYRSWPCYCFLNPDSQLCYKNPDNQMNLLLARRAGSPGLLQSSGTLKASDKMARPSVNDVPVAWSFLTYTTWLQKIPAILHASWLCSLLEKVSQLFSRAWHSLLTFRTVCQIQELHRVAGIEEFGVFFFFICIFRYNNWSWYGSAAIRDINSFIFLLFRYGSDIRRGERMG